MLPDFLLDNQLDRLDIQQYPVNQELPQLSKRRMVVESL